MTPIETFEFGNPSMFLFLLAIPVLIAIYWFYSYKKDSKFLSIWRIPNNAKRPYIQLTVLVSLLLASFVFYLAQPQISAYAPSAVPRGDYLILQDVSRSMEARTTPEHNSRFETSEEISIKLVNTIHARWQIWAFSEFALPVSNLTDNREYLHDVIKNGIYTDVIPRPGSELAAALDAIAIEKMENPEYEDVSYVILLADGDIGRVSTVVLEESLANLREAGISVISVGIGSTAGERIPIYRDGQFTGEYAQIRGGGTYVSHLQEDNMRHVATATNGRYFTQHEIDELIEYVLDTFPEETEQQYEAGEVLSYNNIGWIPLLAFIALFAVLLVNFRRFY